MRLRLRLLLRLGLLCCAAGLDEREDVLLGHAAAAAGARDLADVDAVLGSDPRDDRRDERLLAAAVAVGRDRRGRQASGAGSGGGGLGRRRLALGARRRLGLGGGLLRRGLGRCLFGAARSLGALGRDHRELRPDLDRLALLDEDLLHDARAGLGTSVSTLSVEISSSDSSASIGSPSCLSHFVIVPSETETPIWGMTTSIADVVAISTPRPP